jgi:hypothetical protein
MRDIVRALTVDRLKVEGKWLAVQRTAYHIPLIW